MRYIISIFLLGFLIAPVCYADDISISADTDKREITIDSQLSLTITVTGSASDIPQPDIPELKGFTAYSSGRSQNLSIINNKISSSISFNYILVPNSAGDHELGPFTIDYKGKVYSAGPINIKVLPPGAQQQNQPLPAQSGEEGARPEQGKELFIEAYVDKLRAYVNEQITLTFAVYQAVNLFDNPVYNPPSTTGFWTEDMPPQKKYYKIINGTRYLVTEIKTALFATGPGEFTIGQARLEASVEDIDRFFSKNPFDIFDRDPFGMLKRGKPVILMTEPIKVEIMPLPDQGRPLNFKGDVGSFDISVSVDKNSVEENQPVNLKIGIKGKGNIKTISSPAIPDIPDAKFYEAGSSENISKDNYVVQGEKIFEKMIIPGKEEELSIGPIEYSYFDPALKDYVNKRVEAMAVNVTGSKEEPAAIMRSAPEEVRLLKKDIAHIKLFPTALKSKNRFLYKNKIFLSLNIFPLFILIALYLYTLYVNRLKTDIGYARSLRARGSASKRLKGAKKIMAGNAAGEFYTEIYRAVIEYIADKLNIPHPSITKDLLEYRLKGSGVRDDVIAKVKILFDDCDMARFAPVKFSREDMENTLKEAEGIIMDLERII
ncbi:MAG: BatD family protein [Candidatus Omnitrophota bacterium]|jgi:hypothetical protein